MAQKSSGVPSPEVRNFAAKIRRLRDALNLKQQYIADELGIDPKTYRALETGQTEFKYSHLQKMTKIFGISFTEMLECDHGTSYNSHPEGYLPSPDKSLQNSPADTLEKAISALEATIVLLQESLRDEKADNQQLRAEVIALRHENQPLRQG
jgi:transcriptional regulator with XRE-family HTH domain